MRQKSNSMPASSEALVRNIRRATRKHHAAEEKIRVVLDGLRGGLILFCAEQGFAGAFSERCSKPLALTSILPQIFSLARADAVSPASEA
jgi:hypothetical protein